jgi:hypothetical protein
MLRNERLLAWILVDGCRRDYKESKPISLKSSYSTLRGEAGLNATRNGVGRYRHYGRSEKEKSEKTARSDGSAPRSCFREKLSKL